MAVGLEIDLHEGPPLGSHWLPYEFHGGLSRRSICLLGIARDAGADNILPIRRAAAFSWNDVIQVEVLPVKNLATILAGILVPLEDVVASELDLFLWKSIEHEQKDHLRDTDSKRNRADMMSFGLLFGEGTPLTEIKSLKRSFWVLINYLGSALEE